MKKMMFLGVALVMGVTAAQTAQAEDFNGTYGGLQSGFGVVKFSGAVLDGAVDDVHNSFTLGGVVGYRGQIDESSPIVLGAEADLDFYTNGSDWRYGAYGLAGFKISEKDLLYGRVGYAKLSSSISDTLDGMVYGGGYERSIGNMASLRLDYRYLNYGDTNLADNAVKYSGHEAKVALIVNF